MCQQLKEEEDRRRQTVFQAFWTILLKATKQSNQLLLLYFFVYFIRSVWNAKQVSKGRERSANISFVHRKIAVRRYQYAFFFCKTIRSKMFCASANINFTMFLCFEGAPSSSCLTIRIVEYVDVCRENNFFILLLFYSWVNETRISRSIYGFHWASSWKGRHLQNKHFIIQLGIIW